MTKAIVTLLICLGANLRSLAEPQFEVGEIAFDPIGPGKNVLHVSLHNRSSEKRIPGIAVTARSNDGQNEWKGWTEFGLGAPVIEGRVQPSSSAIPAGETRDARYVFQIPEPFGPRAGITVMIYDLSDQPKIDARS